jgi:hypothetical protein
MGALDDYFAKTKARAIAYAKDAPPPPDSALAQPSACSVSTRAVVSPTVLVEELGRIAGELEPIKLDALLVFARSLAARSLAPK